MANSKSKKGRKILIFSLIGVTVVALTLVAIFRKREPVIAVQTEKVARRNLTELVVANGRIHPVVYVKISPEVSGEIIELPVKEGQKVKKGDLLVKIKPDQYIAMRNSSDAGYKSALAGQRTAQSNLDRAEAEFIRNEALHKTNLVSDSVFLDALTAYEVAKAQLQNTIHQVEMADAGLKRAEEDLLKTTIYSPLDGTVARLGSQAGERVVGTAMMAGTDIMTIVDFSEMEARVDIGEIDVPLIALGQNARMEVDAFKDRKFTGTVTEIANSSKGAGFGGMFGGGSGGGGSQEATKFEVKIRIKEKEIFRPGMSVMAEVETRSRTNVLAVPIASVTTRLPKKPPGDKNPGKKTVKAASNPGETNAAPSKNTNAVEATAASSCAVSSTNSSAGGTNTVGSSGGKKPGDAPKPIEVVFVKEGERAKMVAVKHGISDDAYMEITDGLQEGQEVVSGGYKAISRDLEDSKKIRIGTSKAEEDKDKDKEKK
jgi:HlyD family secretion protein